MRIFIYSLKILIVVCALLWMTGQSCKQPNADKEGTDSLAIRESITSSPVISPAEAINKMHLEDGFAVQLVAAEPLITAPVAMTFDKEGRIWVLQMNDYMPDTLGTGEDKPSGKVVILSDNNDDGIMDSRKVFLDSLILP